MAIHYDKLSPDRPIWLGGGQWIIPDLKDITVLFGKNSSGKSILLRNLQEEEPATRHYTSPERAGNIQYNQNIMQQELDPNARGSQRRGKNQAAQFREESISRIGSLMMKIGSIAGRERGIPHHMRHAILDDIENMVDTLLPNFKFVVKDNQPFFELRRIGDELSQEQVAQPGHLSSGEAELLTLALDLLTICNIWVLEGCLQRLLLIDEPDTHLHPDLQVRLAEFLVELSDKFDTQLMLATHSTTLLASLGQFGQSKVEIVYLNNSQSQQNVIPFDSTLRELSTCLGGHVLMGPLFGAPLLLVEGDDDYRIWSQVPRHPGYRQLFAVIPTEGDEIFKYQKTLEALLGSLRDNSQQPAGYALLDDDKGLPTQQAQNHIRYIQLNCREVENLYLSAEVLNKMGLTWAEAQEKLLSEAGQYGGHEQALRTCRDWDRQHGDIKAIIESISEILDPKKLHWTVRVGKTLGERKPLGELSDFLGDDVITALWP